ncbi:hypothetical protein PX701_00190 [Agromyces sp. H3Y2-19a]|uniref:hypothetical protein n=1 Tax=Agromyces TaxID=33877 RepID=UPI001E640766|nr:MULTISPECIES: hypothetical protein [Agromyces]MCD5345657.1 hypothetical protein [Agromyces sp. S2-1-8]MDF0512024.1 hypothetical protein [Agromyces chromiiresistens]
MSGDGLDLGDAFVERTVEPRTGADRVDAVVLGWCRWYTRDLAEPVATARRAELASDLYEERAVAAETGERGVSRSIVGRLIRGIPADLSWRQAQLRRLALTAPRGTFPLAMPALAHLATALLLAWGVLVVWRTVASMASGDWAGAWDLVAAGVFGLAMAVLGAVLTAAPRFRWLGALWLAAASYVLIRFGMYALIASSTTLGAFYAAAIEQAMLVNRAMSAAGVLFFVAMAAWWLPSAGGMWARRRRSDPTVDVAPTGEEARA